MRLTCLICTSRKLIASQSLSPNCPFPSKSNFMLLRKLSSGRKSPPDLPPPKPLLKTKAKGTKTKGQDFIDETRVKVIGGKGGNGCIAFTRYKGNEFAGPDGGDGGNGGHVIFTASFDVNSLGHLPSIIRGNDGEKGFPENCFGKGAEPVVVKVPFGTIIKSEDGEKIVDLKSVEESVFLAARGGAGGRGNKFFATPENQSPKISEFGAEGESIVYNLEVSTIAHVGLVGFPNAGKSTLLQAITRARPKVAPYPFTTLKPHIGMVLYDDLEQVANVPGLIENAHLNRGLGISFLRHIERCVCLIYVIDLSQPEPWNQLDILRSELDHYNPSLTKRPSIVMANKIDLDEAKSNLESFKSHVNKDFFVVPTSAKHGINLEKVLQVIRQFYDQETDKLRIRLEKEQSKQSEIDLLTWTRSNSV